MTNQSSAKPTDAGVLTINGGSSSIKFALFEVGDSLQRLLKRGITMTERQIAAKARENLHNKQSPAIGWKSNLLKTVRQQNSLGDIIRNSKKKRDFRKTATATYVTLAGRGK